MPLNETQAYNEVARMTQSDEYPTLTNDDLTLIVETNIRYNAWVANTTYQFGDIVVPVIQNGRTYECITAGTTGDTNQFPQFYTAYATGITFSDATVTWVDAGPANTEKYDVRSAVRAGWILKAAKVANLINSKDGSQDIQLENLHKQCLTMAERYRPLVIY
jgi:hypothetical protein